MTHAIESMLAVVGAFLAFTGLFALVELALSRPKREGEP